MNDSTPQHQKTLTQRTLNILVHAGAIVSLLLLIRAYLTGNLGFNPIEAATRQTGRIAIAFLLLSLICTPINRLFRLPLVGKLRKPLGLYAAFFALLHFAIFAIWDYGLNLALIWTEIIQKPFIILGAVGLLILVLLGVTSFRTLQRKMGRLWKTLHRLVYLAGVLIVVHYFLAVKGNLFSLQGGYTGALIAGSSLLVLLILRLPAVYQPLRKGLGNKSAKKPEKNA